MNAYANPSNVHSLSHNSPNTSHNFPSSPSHNYLHDVFELDIPIAHRKGTSQCAKDPIANYLSYHKLSDSPFKSKIANLFVPRNIQEALNYLNWKLAVMEEMNAPKQNCIWDIVELPKAKKTVGCK